MRNWIDRIPLITLVLMDGGHLLHVWRMWQEGSSAGQSVWGWALGLMAYCLWLVWFYHNTPDQHWAFIGTGIAMVVNVLVIVSIFWWRV